MSKLFLIKVVEHSMSYKVSGRICLSTPGGELGASKDLGIDTSIDAIDTFAKVSILYRYLFSSILSISRLDKWYKWCDSISAH